MKYFALVVLLLQTIPGEILASAGLAPAMRCSFSNQKYLYAKVNDQGSNIIIKSNARVRAFEFVNYDPLKNADGGKAIDSDGAIWNVKRIYGKPFGYSFRKVNSKTSILCKEVT